MKLDLWKKTFGNIEKWDDPTVLERLKKKALAIMDIAMTSKTGVTAQQHKAAETVFKGLVTKEVEPTVSIHITQKVIQDRLKRTGLAPITLKARTVTPSLPKPKKDAETGE